MDRIESNSEQLEGSDGGKEARLLLMAEEEGSGESRWDSYYSHMYYIANIVPG